MTGQIRVVMIPENHPYTRAIRPDTVVTQIDPPQWWPHRALKPSYYDHPVDLVHLHFGFEHLSLRETCEFAESLPCPLVLTVHDLDNPHLDDQTGYHAQLEVLTQAASRVITLSDKAREIIRARYHVEAEVIPHPRIVDKHYPRGNGSPAVFLKSLRSNVVSDPSFYKKLIDACGAEVYAHRDAPRCDEVITHRHEPMSDDTLWHTIAAHRVVVLPYTRGTHSGWMRMCLDLGVSVAVPDCGCYASQAGEDPRVMEYATGDGVDAARVVKELLARTECSPPSPPDTTAIARRHEEIYQEVMR